MMYLLVITLQILCVCESVYKKHDVTIKSVGDNLFEDKSMESADYEETATEDTPLKDFLKRYTEGLDDERKKSGRFPSNSHNEHNRKSWNLLHTNQQNHPHDKKGWVTLEAVPWSVSKVSKWHSNHKPTDTLEQWNYGDRPSKPHNNPHDYDVHDYYNKPDPRPSYTPPKITSHKRPQSTYQSHNNFHKNEDLFDDDIITDGLPANFPNREFTRRHNLVTERLPVTHPSNGDGEWVLLSTTKGYKYPKHRSLKIETDSIATHPSVHLTVLPPSKNSKINMTTSHGGLLEVESTFETVDQAHKTFARKQRTKKLTPSKASIRKPHVIKNAVSINKTKNNLDTQAVLAAVGAGMIPATMAMLVPMAMGGRRKRNIEITLQR